MPSDRHQRFGLPAMFRPTLAFAFLSGGLISSAFAQSPAIERLDAVGPALGACIKSKLASEGKRHAGNREVTLAMAFRADGTLMAPPTVAFSMPEATQPDQQRFVLDVSSALANCTPLRFSSSLGGAIAGRPYRFRYRINKSQDQRA
jgi:hypothetical protein